MRYKPVREYRFYRNSRGGWIYKSFFFHSTVVENAGGRDPRHWQWGTVILKKKIRPKSNEFKISYCCQFGSHRFKRVGGFWKDFHGTLFRVPTRQTLSSLIGQINISIWAKSRTNIGIFWKRDIFVLLKSYIRIVILPIYLSFSIIIKRLAYRYIIETADI